MPIRAVEFHARSILFVYTALVYGLLPGGENHGGTRRRGYSKQHQFARPSLLPQPA